MKKPSKKKILVIVTYMIIGISLITISWLLIIIWIMLCLYNEFIVCKTKEYNVYPSAEGRAKRNYDRLILGGSWLFLNRARFDTSTNYIDAAYQRNLPMIFYCCKRLYSLVKNKGEVVLYLGKNLQKHSDYKYSLLDRSFILPAIRWKDGIKYNSIHQFLPLFCTPSYYISALISDILKKYNQKSNDFKEIQINDLAFTNIDLKVQENIKQMQIFCDERELNFRLMIN